MEVKIGVLHTPREIVLESTDAPSDVEAAVAKAIADGKGTLALSDEKGRRVIVPAGLVAYVEIAKADARRVGFAG